MTESLTVAGAHVPPGERRDLAPLVSESYTGDRTTLPMAVVNGTGNGPTVFVTAAIHGDELNGIAICQQLLTELDPATLSGAVIIVPIANVLGAQIRSRYLPDRRDLNRSFPGTSRGSMAARIARILHEEVVRGSTAGIDLHTAANRRANVPQLRIDTSDAGAMHLAEAFGAPYVLDASLRSGSLRETARQRGVPVLTYEAGEPLRFDDEAIRIGTDGILRVLHLLDMVDGAPPTGPAAPGDARVHVAARGPGWDPRAAGRVGRPGRGGPARLDDHQPARCRTCHHGVPRRRGGDRRYDDPAGRAGRRGAPHRRAR